MNEDTVAGKLKSAGGKIKQTAGETVGNQELANSGTADQVKGAVQESWGKTKDAASDVSSVATRNSETDATANTVRGKVAKAAEDTKNFVGEAMDQLRGKVHEHELDRDGHEVHQVQ